RLGAGPRRGARAGPAAASLFDAGADSLAFPGVADYRPDRYTGPLGLAYLLVQKPCFFYIELGDTDEYAHRRDYPSYLSALTEFDDFLGQLDATLLALHRDAIVIVTPDQGRAADFGAHGAAEPSSPAWVVAAGGPLPSRGLRVPAAPRHLRDIAPTLRLALGLPPDGSAFAGSPLEELLAGEGQPRSPARAPPSRSRAAWARPRRVRAASAAASVSATARLKIHSYAASSHS